MRKYKLFIPLLVLFLCIAWQKPAYAGTVYTLSDVNLRSRPDLASEAVCTVEKDTKLTTLGSVKSWVKVSYGKKKGYIYGLYLARGKKKPPVARKVNSSDVNFRQSPGGKVIRVLKKGEHVLVISLSVNHWLKIKTYDGKKGYVYSKYLTCKTIKDQRIDQVNAWRVKAIRYCKKRLGDKYSQEKRDEKGYADCSSLMRDAFHSVCGGDIGDYSNAQKEVMKGYFYKIKNIYQVTPGDIVYHLSGDNENHCGIYAGNGVVINASQTKGKVKKSYYDGSSTYWEYGCKAAVYCYDSRFK